MKKLVMLMLLFLLDVTGFGQKRDLNQYIGDTVVVKKIPSYMNGYEDFYKSLRPTPKTREEIMASIPRNDSTIFLNDGKGRTPSEKLSGMRFFCSKLISQDSYSYLELQSLKYGILYYKVSDYGDFVLNTLEMQKESDKLDSERERINRESQQRRIESKALLSQLYYGTDDKYHYKKTIKVAGAQTQTLLSKTKTFFKDFTQTTEGPKWQQIASTTRVVGAVSSGGGILMNLTIQNSQGQYTYDLYSIEFLLNGSWRPAETVLASTNPIFDEYKTDVLAGILYISQEIENKIK